MKHVEAGGGILRLPLYPSARLRSCALLLQSGLAAVAALLAPPFHVLLAAAALLLFAVELRARRRPARFVTLEVRDRAHCWLLDAAGQRFSARLLPGSCLHPRLTTLYLRHARGLHTVLLLPDNTPDALRRRLRVRLALPVR